MKTYLVQKQNNSGAHSVLRQAAEVLQQQGAEVLLDESMTDLWPPLEGATVLPEAEAFARADVVVTIGGDGTLLHTARKALVYNTPVLGVNTGRLGFLALVERDELHKLKRLTDGDYTVECRSVLRADSGTMEPFHCLALNDIVLFKERVEQTIGLDIYCDDILVSRFRGDGIVFATPTGSTAYSMSAGGPVLDARLGGIVATQICAHIVQTPPMVFAADRVLRVVPQDPQRERVMVSCDGAENLPLAAGEDIVIRQAEEQAPLVQFHDAGQLKSMDTKLKGR